MYTKTIWKNLSPPSISASNLNKIEDGIYDAHQRLDDLSRGGTTAQRPSNPKMYHPYFDTDLGKPIWWSGSKWVDSNGVEV